MNLAVNLKNQYLQCQNPLPLLRKVTGKNVVFTYAGWGEHTFFMNYDVNISDNCGHKDAVTVCLDEDNNIVTLYDSVERTWYDSQGYRGNF